MENELSGVVIGSTENVLQPDVRIFYNDRQNKPMAVEEVDLSRRGINVTGYDSPEKWNRNKLQSFRDNKTALSVFQ